MATKRFTESAVLLSSDGVKIEVSETENARKAAGRHGSLVAERERSLYEILQDNKLEKESEFAMKISQMNAPPGLDEEEANFLNDAIEQQVQTEMVRKLADAKEIAAYTSAVREIVREAPEPERVSFMNPVFETEEKNENGLQMSVVPKRKRPRVNQSVNKPDSGRGDNVPRSFSTEDARQIKQAKDSTQEQRAPDRAMRGSQSASIVQYSYSSSEDEDSLQIFSASSIQSGPLTENDLC